MLPTVLGMTMVGSDSLRLPGLPRGFASSGGVGAYPSARPPDVVGRLGHMDAEIDEICRSLARLALALRRAANEGGQYVDSVELRLLIDKVGETAAEVYENVIAKL